MPCMGRKASYKNMDPPGPHGDSNTAQPMAGPEMKFSEIEFFSSRIWIVPIFI